MDDYISREQALKEKWTLENLDSIDEEVVSVSDIEKIPSADVRENIHGEWEYKKIENTSIVGYWCTNCHIGNGTTTSFCPNCGADMRGET